MDLSGIQAAAKEIVSGIIGIVVFLLVLVAIIRAVEHKSFTTLLMEIIVLFIVLFIMKALLAQFAPGLLPF